MPASVSMHRPAVRVSLFDCPFFLIAYLFGRLLCFTYRLRCQVRGRRSGHKIIH
jgi:hypothetical protein